MLAVDSLHKVYPARGKSAPANTVFTDVTFSIRDGEFVCVVGPSGCGKSTLLDCIAGLTPYDAGRVSVDGVPVVGTGADRVVVFQNSSLLPWRTLSSNVAYGAELRGMSKKERKPRVQRAIEMVGLAGFENHYPHQLSGGMQQRANLARALVLDAPVVLMDEPFGALDAMKRREMQDELLLLHAELGRTVFFVTHDLEEALYLSDRVLIMGLNPGRIHRDISVGFARPRTRDLAETADFRRLARELHDELHSITHGSTTES